MKALPCSSKDCRGDRQRLGQRLLGRVLITLPDGSPHLVGQPSSFPLRVPCAACKRPTTITAAAWNALPELTAEDMEAFDVLSKLAKDWTGAGLAEDHARDMVGAGIMGPAAVAGRSAPEANQKKRSRKQ